MSIRGLQQRTRVLGVAGAFVALALSVGVGAVLAGGAVHGDAVARKGPVPRAPLSLGGKGMIVGHAMRSDHSRPLRTLRPPAVAETPEPETSPNPHPVSRHLDHVDTVRQSRASAPNMPLPSLSVDGITFLGGTCGCAPPDTNGEVGLTQYVQAVNKGFQVFDKSTGLSVYGPVAISTVWGGLGGVCETNTKGDPVVLYDQLADRWLITQFAGTGFPTDECIAVSSSSDATGGYARYEFHLGSDFFDYPHLGVWPDAYYLSMNVFTPGLTFLGPQPFALDRAAMLAGDPNATFVTTRQPDVFNGANDGMLPADLDGTMPPPTGAPEPFLMSGESSTWHVWRFHVDWASPASSTFTLGGNLTPAGYTELCKTTVACVPQPNGQSLDGIGDRGMFRLAYRSFGDREALVGNQSVSSGGVAGIRWYEIANATSGVPAFVQQSTYQPDTTWRWLGSTAMDGVGDLALGFSASSPTVVPALRYAGRLVSDPAGTLAQGEATLFPGAGSQADTSNRWGDYSDLTVDPVDDCTFWFTSEYYPAGSSSYNWRTRIGRFRFPSCHTVKPVLVSRAGNGSGTVSSSPAGIACGSSCSRLFDLGATVTLTAAPDASSSFAGWSGGSCSGTGPCTISIDGAKAVTATFALRSFTVGVTKAGAGVGSVTSSPAGIACPSTCLASYLYGSSVTLTAAANVGSRFVGWSGACTGTAPCVLTLTANQAVTATFSPPPVRCVVPRVVGLRLAKARARIVRSHCRVGKVRHKASRRAKRGRVLAQAPRAGRKLARGAKVRLTVGR